MVANQQERQQLEAVIQEWKTAHTGRDVDRLKSMWAQDYDNLFFIAEENNDAIVGWEAINKRFEGMRGGTGRRELDIDNLKVDVIGDLAYAYCTFLMTVDMKAFDRIVTFDGRFSFIFRRTRGQWKFIQYHESLSRDKNQEVWGFSWK